MTNIWVTKYDWDMSESYRKWEYYESLKKAAEVVLNWYKIDENDLKLSKPFNFTKVWEKNPIEELEKIHDLILKLNQINIWWKVEEILKDKTYNWKLWIDETLNYIKETLKDFIK